MLWQPSPQYQNMPHDQYMQTDEGKRSQQAFAQWGNWVNQGMQNTGRQNTSPPSPAGGKVDMSAYAPGNARPAQLPTQSAPAPSEPRPADYGMDWSYRPGVNAPGQPVDQMRPAVPTTFNFAPSPNGGTMPYAPPQPQAYYDRSGQAVPDPTQVATFRPTYYDLTGKPVSFDQQQAQRAAAMVQTQQADLPFRLANVFNQNIGSNALNYQSVLGQANKMVEGGFYNPFSAMYGQGQGVGGTPDLMSTVSQYTPPSMYNPRQPFSPAGIPGYQQPLNPIQDLFARNNIQTPPGFMDQLISLLGGSAPRSPIQQTPPMSGLPTQPSMGDGLRYVPAPGAPPFRPGAAQPIQSPSQGTPYGQDSRQSDAQRAALAYAQRSADNFFGNGNFDHATVEDLKRLGYSGPQAELILKENEVRRKAARERAKSMYGEGWDDSMMPASDREAGRNKLKEATERYLDERLKQTDWEAWRRKQQQREAAAAPVTPRPAPRAATPEDIAAIEKGRQYKQSQLNAFKSQFAANVRAGRYTLAGMSPELLQTARSGVESGDRDWGAWAEALYGPGAVSRMQAAGHYR